MPASVPCLAGSNGEWLALGYAMLWCERIQREVYKGDVRGALEDAQGGKWELLHTRSLGLPPASTLPTAWAALWLGHASVPGWPPDGDEMKRWGTHIPSLEGHRPLALRILVRRLVRLHGREAQMAGRREVLDAIEAVAPSKYAALREHLHRHWIAVETESTLGSPRGWRTGHLTAAARVDDLTETLASRHCPSVRALRVLAKGK